ncbi:hypothetical protein [Sphingorhabdus sp. M41]|uniref:hypothetical protein n=1 Tax=Sphingorhabdus sp. M41 TaxID=1806885 RepID=UPI00078B7B4D|nr:hypothetical protein [Sphingorhabdus sp. M41]AMO72712.1 hypothetical protein AZE99_13410 [Sphingorhabdus sp. M41]
MVGKTKPERMRPEDYAPGESPMRRGVTYVRKEIVSKGVGFGSALAIAISFTTHKSILWAIIHGFFSWAYVVYYALTR